MSQGSFLAALNAAPRRQDQRQQVMDVLDEFCRDIQTYANSTITAAPVPGFLTNYGQEYRIVLHSVPRNLDHVLLRAHVPAGGLPVRLDLYDEDLLVCQDIASLRAALTQFVQRPATINVIDTLRA